MISVPKSNSVVKRPINKPYSVDRREMKDNPEKDSETVKSTDENKVKYSSTSNEDQVRRQVSIFRELKRK